MSKPQAKTAAPVKTDDTAPATSSEGPPPKTALPTSPSAPRTRQAPPERPALRFSPTAWAKLLHFRDRGGTEIGGFGISAEDNPLLIQEFVTVKQEVTGASISFDDEAVAEFFDQQVDIGRTPEQFARVWLHSHPGDSPVPSSIDEETFQRVFGRCDWAVMFVIGQVGKTYARLRFNVGPGGQTIIPVQVDYSTAFGPSDIDAWEKEYKANVHRSSWSWGAREALDTDQEMFGADPSETYDAEDWMAAFEDLEPEGRSAILQELASRPDLWHEAEEVMPW